MKPAHTSQCTGGMRSLLLSKSKNWSSLVTWLTTPSRPYRQPWYLQANARQLPDDSCCGCSCQTTLLPRCAHTLWNA
ncbi:hypothetical protein [Mycobacterium bourgelatii]|uniref:hypothetical protein n=1 Tax=Mycobacterium bourgelatii TaxID=1273442 RepID=UPI001F07959A|nr:hypothetical protein [Mycobacterium bourgelatii]